MGRLPYSRKPSKLQKEALVDFLETNPQITNAFTFRSDRKNLWSILAARLNALEGPQKEVHQWQKFCTDWKLGLKRKVRDSTCDSDEHVFIPARPLAEIEERLLNTCNMDESFLGQDAASTSTCWVEDDDCIDVKTTNITVDDNDIDDQSNDEVQNDNDNETEEILLEIQPDRKRKSNDLAEDVETKKFRHLTDIGCSLTAIKVETTEMKNCMKAVVTGLENLRDTPPTKRKNERTTERIEIRTFHKLDEMGDNLESIKDDMAEMKHCMLALVKGVKGLTGAVTRLASVFERME